MTGKLHLEPPISPNEVNLFKQITKHFRIQKTDLPFAIPCIGALIYFSWQEPLFVTILGCLCLTFLSLAQIIRALPMVEKTIGTKIKFWHVTTLILTLTITLSLFETPAQAFFLSGLESFFQDLIAGSQTGGGSSIDSDAVTLVFNLIRGVFLISVVAAALFAYNQAQQGNDWRPIVTQVGIAFAVVIGIDIITYLFTPS